MKDRNAITEFENLIIKIIGRGCAKCRDLAVASRQIINLRDIDKSRDFFDNRVQ